MRMRRWAWLLVLPWAIVNDMTWPIKYICEQVAIPDDVEGFKTTDQEYCLDIAAALNEARERRIHPPKIEGHAFTPNDSVRPRMVVTDSGTFPCCEDEHKGFLCSVCEPIAPGAKPCPCPEQKFEGGLSGCICP